MSGNQLEAVVDAARSAELFDRAGTVLRTDGDLIGVGGANFRQRELARVQGTSGSWLAAECAAVHEGEAQLALLERGSVAVGASVVAAEHAVSAPVGDALLGRVLDGLGRPATPVIRSSAHRIRTAAGLSRQARSRPPTSTSPSSSPA